jgi:hypothetical protein
MESSRRRFMKLAGHHRLGLAPAGDQGCGRRPRPGQFELRKGRAER